MPGRQSSDEGLYSWADITRDKRKPLAAGGCFCGKVRFETSEEPLKVFYCHCRHCQLAAGALLTVSVLYKKTAVRFLGDEPQKYKTSELAKKGFCSTCGTTIYNTHYFPEVADYYTILKNTAARSIQSFFLIPDTIFGSRRSTLSCGRRC